MLENNAKLFGGDFSRMTVIKAANELHRIFYRAIETIANGTGPVTPDEVRKVTTLSEASKLKENLSIDQIVQVALYIMREYPTIITTLTIRDHMAVLSKKDDILERIRGTSQTVEELLCVVEENIGNYNLFNSEDVRARLINGYGDELVKYKSELSDAIQKTCLPLASI